MNWLFIDITIFVAIMLGTYRWFMVIVPEFTALGMLNLFTGKMQVLFSGWHIKAPWKQVKPENFVSLVKITVPIDEDYVAQDGSVVKIKGFAQYRSQNTLEGVLKYLMAEDNQIIENIVGRVKNHLIKDIANENYESVRTKILEIGKDLSIFFEDKPGQVKEMKDIEDEFGITIERVVISDVGYDTDTQEAITSKFEMKTVSGSPTPTDGQLIMLGKKIEKKVYGLDLGAIDPNVAKVLAKSAEEIAKSASGPVLAAGVAAAAATKGGQQQSRGGK